MTVPLWRQFTRGLRALIHRRENDQAISDEVHHYLAQATVEHKARGLSTDAAERAARIELGSVSAVSEQIRNAGWERWLDTVAADLRYSARRLIREPGFTIVAVLTLAVGIGGTTAIFSAVSPILFDALPYPEADRLVQIQELDRKGTPTAGTFGMSRALAQRAHSLEFLSAYKAWQPALTGSGQAERLDGQRVSADYFRVLGVTPVLGRGFEALDDQPNGGCSVVISDALWRRRFGAEPSLVGRAITLNGNPCVVVGVMPGRFTNAVAPEAQLWGTLQYDMTQGRAWGHHLALIGRLRADVGYKDASHEFNALGQAVVQEAHPETYATGFSIRAVGLKDELTLGVRPALYAIMAAVSLVLVIACVNVTNLLLARGARRRGEFALRAALGAAQGRLAGQLLTESLLLALIGSGAGLAVAQLGIRGLAIAGAEQLPALSALVMDGRVFVFGFLLTVLVGVGFGLVPALHASRSNPHQAMQAGTRRSSASHRATGNALVVAEVALALVLLVGSGLLLRSLARLFAVDPGFRGGDILSLQIQGVGTRFSDVATSSRYFGQVREAVARIPGNSEVALTSQLPLSTDLDEYGVHFEISPTEKAEGGSTFRYAVSSGYLETMGIPLRRGRTFTIQDDESSPRVALLSESYAARVFHGADPIGQRLRIGPADGAPFTVVGIVGDVRQQSLSLSRTDAVYIPFTQWLFPDNVMSLVIRTRGSAPAALTAIRQAIWSVDPDQPIVRVATMDELLADSAAARRFSLRLFECFGLAALILAGAGIYGVLSGSVVERTREIGVRSALGASRGMIVGLVMRQGLALTLIGVAIGLVAALLATPAIEALLFGVSRLDPLTYLAVIGLLGSVAMIACLVPAWRAARVDPVTTLRQD